MSDQEIDECDWIDKDGCKCTNEEYGIIIIGDIFGPEPTTFVPYCKKHKPQARRFAKKHKLMMAEGASFVEEEA